MLSTFYTILVNHTLPGVLLFSVHRCHSPLPVGCHRQFARAIFGHHDTIMTAVECIYGRIPLAFGKAPDIEHRTDIECKTKNRRGYVSQAMQQENTIRGQDIGGSEGRP
jgi:hypothetical protein